VDTSKREEKNKEYRSWYANQTKERRQLISKCNAERQRGRRKRAKNKKGDIYTSKHGYNKESPRWLKELSKGWFNKPRKWGLTGMGCIKL